MRCFHHHDIEAIAVCRSCGRGICTACARATELHVTCSAGCEARAEALARQVVASAALAVSAQRFTRVTPRIYLLLAAVLLVLGGLIASLTQNRVLASTAPALWLLAAFCVLFAAAMAFVWWRLKGQDVAATMEGEP